MDSTTALFQAQATLANLPALQSKDSEIFPRYINKPKSTGQIRREQGLIGLDEKEPMKESLPL